ncbi:MAG: Ata11 protein, partial [Parcubacteria group bacterium GW2011_GWE2_40_8]
MDNVKLAQGNIFQRIRFIFRKYLNISFIKEPLKIILNLLVNILAKLKRFKFPLKYQWDWKLEMLLSLYEKDTTVLFRKIIKPDMIIVDIGAHIGYYSRIFSKLTKEGGVVYAFEPDHDNYKLLKLNTKNLKNIRIFNEALSDKTGSISFYKSNNTGYHSLVTQNSVKEVATVPTQTLDNFIQENRVAKIDLIKIDVEGGEPVVFDGCKNIFKQSSLI